MRLAALVSGGKDSCHALGLAAAGGHAVVCMLNLAPADAGAHDADSHCFQTVGHAALDALAEATGLPLLRRRMTGASVDTGMLYDGGSGGAGDEVEDLAALVAAAAAAFPGLDGVVSGAVASDYQRLRVENVRDGEGGGRGPGWRCVGRRPHPPFLVFRSAPGSASSPSRPCGARPSPACWPTC